MTNLTCFIQERGFAFVPDFSGDYQRFDRNGKTLNGWARGVRHTVNGKVIDTLEFGDWATGEKHAWSDAGIRALSPEETEALEIAARAEKAAHAKIKEETQRLVADDCDNVWPNLIDRGRTAYMVRKKIDALYGARISPEDAEVLMVPMRDIDGKLWGIQWIGDKSKYFTKGQRISGLMHILGGLPDGYRESFTGTIYVTEGFATGASIYQAVGGACVCAFTAGNLGAVTKILRERFPAAGIVVCGDSDLWTKRANGEPYNPGREAAVAAASGCGGSVRLPNFVSLDGRPNDFNDLHCLEGLARVTDQITNPEKFAPIEPRLTSLAYLNDKGKLQSPKHQEVADRLLDFYNGKLIKQDRDIFAYTGTHWRLLQQHDTDKLRQQMQLLFGGMANASAIKSAFELFVTGMDAAPDNQDMFTPHPSAANFTNGTLFVTRARGKYTLDFRKHAKEDYLINCLPIEYHKNWDATPWQAQNPELAAMFERIFEGDKDKLGKMRACQQLLGACLLPSFPHLFMLYGRPGTGKSTLMKIAARLVHKDNLCDVEPHEFEGFNMESMAGKLVNMDTDITTTKPISDSVVKKIEDRRSFRIRRKNVKDLYAPLPATHIFGGNSIPKTLEGASRAHDRRWTFIGFDRVLTNGEYDREYADVCYEAGPKGVLAFAMLGLMDLLDSKGLFFNPESGREKMEEWQLDSDGVGQFLADAKSGEVLDGNSKLMFEESDKIERGRLYSIFIKWGEEAGYRGAMYTSRKTFYGLLRSKGYVDYEANTGWSFKGIGVKVAPTAAM